MADMARLRESKEYEGKAWIGLFSNPGKENRMWHWSLPGVKYTEHETRWGASEPDDQKENENCVKTRENWADVTCDWTMWFICYDGENMWIIVWFDNITELKEKWRESMFEESYKLFVFLYFFKMFVVMEILFCFDVFP